MAHDTKERILDAAERSFADCGFKTTSMRDITAAAGVNLSSVNYHFGSKNALLEALLDRRFTPINQRRIERLSQIETSGNHGEVQVEQIIRALVSPPFEMLAEWGNGGRNFLRLAGRLYSETDEVRAAVFKKQEPVITRFTTALEHALPALELNEVRLRILFVVGSMAQTMIWGESVGPQQKIIGSPDSLIESLVQFATAGMSTMSKNRVAVRVDT